MRFRLVILPLFLLLFAFQSQSCGPESKKINRMGPDEQADLVYFFNKGTTPDQISVFQRTIVGIPNETGTGYQSLPGEMTNVAVRIDGFDGQALRFQPDATNEQKSFIRDRVYASSLIHKIYENVVPSQIKDLD